MELQSKIMTDLKSAMKAKDKVSLRSLRAVKAALLLAKTDGTGVEIDEAKEVQILQKLIKQRQDSLKIYQDQNRADLAQVEADEIDVIQKYLPEQLGEDELKAAIQAIMEKTGANSMKDMGKVMGMASAQFQGKADNRMVASLVKQLLSA
jgi:uncharacterized protein YqeY|tara:strand:- start:1109 stop:1558 length:450 start_codon:yes stop_codon:yes gene_type:complete